MSSPLEFESFLGTYIMGNIQKDLLAIKELSETDTPLARLQVRTYYHISIRPKLKQLLVLGYNVEYLL